MSMFPREVLLARYMTNSRDPWSVHNTVPVNPPTVLQVCRESHAVTRRYYQLLAPGIWVNLDIDTVAFSQSIIRNVACLPLFFQIKMMTIHCLGFFSFCIDPIHNNLSCIRLLCRHPTLKELTIVDLYSDTRYDASEWRRQWLGIFTYLYGGDNPPLMDVKVMNPRADIAELEVNRSNWNQLLLDFQLSMSLTPHSDEDMDQYRWELVASLPPGFDLEDEEEHD